MSELNNKKSLRLYEGKVISKKMSKTATVLYEWLTKNPRVKKIVRARRKVHVHDPENISGIGDVIAFYEGKPVSKSKNMYFHSIIRKSKDSVASTNTEV